MWLEYSCCSLEAIRPIDDRNADLIREAWQLLVVKSQNADPITHSVMVMACEDV